MDNYTTRKLTLILSAILVAGPLSGSDDGDWARVQAMRRGEPVGVVRTDHTRLDGRFASASGETIELIGPGTVTIRREDVVRIYRPGSSRKKRMWIGAAVGLAAGAAVAAGVAGGSNGEGPFGGPAGGAAAVGAVAGGAGIGFAVGSLGGGYQTIYRKQKGN